jgi:hypothetical protein
VKNRVHHGVCPHCNRSFQISAATCAPSTRSR